MHDTIFFATVFIKLHLMNLLTPCHRSAAFLSLQIHGCPMVFNRAHCAFVGELPASNRLLQGDLAEASPPLGRPLRIEYERRSACRPAVTVRKPARSRRRLYDFQTARGLTRRPLSRTAGSLSARPPENRQRSAVRSI